MIGKAACADRQSSSRRKASRGQVAVVLGPVHQRVLAPLEKCTVDRTAFERGRLYAGARIRSDGGSPVLDRKSGEVERVDAHRRLNRVEQAVREQAARCERDDPSFARRRKVVLKAGHGLHGTFVGLRTSTRRSGHCECPETSEDDRAHRRIVAEGPTRPNSALTRRATTTATRARCSTRWARPILAGRTSSPGCDQPAPHRLARRLDSGSRAL